MRNTHRVAAVAGAVLVTLGAGAGLAFAGDKGDHADACVYGPGQALINAPAFNCADVDVSDVTDTTTTITDSLNEVVDDVLNDLDLPLLSD
jgi:uncharacterized protein YggE